MAGQEAICDAICSQNLSDSKNIDVFAHGLIDSLGLHCEDQIVKVFKNGTSFGPGVTGLFLLSESHLTIHTTPEKRKLYLNVFSCHEFDDALIKDRVVETFGVERFDRWIVLKR
jgi:S-adenosylmethionine decarboxylase